VVFTPPLLDRHWMDCRLPAPDTTARTSAGACHRGAGAGLQQQVGAPPGPLHLLALDLHDAGCIGDGRYRIRVSGRLRLRRRSGTSQPYRACPYAVAGTTHFLMVPFLRCTDRFGAFVTKPRDCSTLLVQV